MTRKGINVSIDEDKLKLFKEYCQGTDKVLSRAIETAMEEYMEKYNGWKRKD